MAGTTLNHRESGLYHWFMTDAKWGLRIIMTTFVVSILLAWLGNIFRGMGWLR